MRAMSVEKMLRLGISGNFLNMVKAMYTEMSSQVKGSFNRLSTKFPILMGVCQGESLSPLLFAIYVNDNEPYLRNAKH